MESSLSSFLNLDDFETYARQTMASDLFLFYSAGADDEVTLRENSDAYKRYQLIPRVLRDVSNIDTRTTILGHPLSFPVCISPTALQGLAHSDGEVGTARGAMSMGVGFTLSCYSTRSIGDVFEAAADCLRFCQLHIFTSKELTLKLVRWAEQTGFKALVLTVDFPVFGNRVRWFRVRKRMVSKFRFGTLDGLGKDRDSADFDPSLTWQDVKWLKSQTSLPIILKGILSVKDVDLALESGADAIFVSTHGGRQLDTIPASIDVLSSVVKAVNGRCEVYVDGGIRHGTDVLKALALGARAVFIGRPAIYSLYHSSDKGVQRMLEILKEEFCLAMGLTGCTRIEDIKGTVEVKHSMGSRL